MKRFVWIVGFAVVAAGVVVALGAPSGASGSTLAFVATPIEETGIDIDGDANLTPGDGWVSNAALWQDDVVVGKVVSSCQYITVRKDGMGGTLQCVSTAKLAGGQITFQQRTVLVEGRTGTTYAAITGGTDAYATAHGYAKSTPVPGEMAAEITVYLFPEHVI